MKRTARAQMPQVAVLLESSQGVSRAMLHGILNYMRVYGPWSLNIAAGGTSDLKMPDIRLWKGTGILGRVTTDTVARDILASRLPAVLFNPSDAYLDRAHPLSKYSRTHCDSHAIGRLAADYYLGKAFQHFAFIGDIAGANWSRWRQEAYAARLAEAGKPCHAYPCPPKRASAWDVERPLLCDWLKRLPKPVALFAANDNRARQVLDACLVADIAVPYEAAVLGVNNDVLICETCIPPLSSIGVDAEKAGYEAARLLDDLMRRTSKGRQVLTYGPTGVVSRASTEVLHVADKLVIRALEYIRINGGLTIRVSDVAGQLGVSSRWVGLRFRQALGCSVLDAIQRARIATVCSMLKETDLPLSLLSKKCGFSQPNHLCSLFKRQFGMSMSCYRTQHRAPSR
jgi:LacI family transcriptional regulator